MKKILILGVAYKKNVDDVRESPAFKLMEILEKRGAQTSFYDPHVPRLPNLREHPEFAGRSGIEFLPPVIAQFDAVIVVTDHDQVDYVELCAHAKLVIDTRNACARAGVTSDNVVKA